jgi:opacity protein-like surface antigen
LIDDDAIAFAWQAGLGVDIDLGHRLRLDLGYRYFSVYQPELTETDGRTVTFDYAAHTGLAGLVFLF